MAADLFGKVREWVPRERRFQVLVLANLCAVMARELRAGAEPSLADVRLFRELLQRPVEPHVPAHEADAAARACAYDLAVAIRRGELDERLGEVARRLREHVARKLEIARPGYAASTRSRRRAAARVGGVRLSRRCNSRARRHRASLIPPYRGDSGTFVA